MNLDFSKIKAFSFKPKLAAGGFLAEPRKLWNKFIWFVIFFAVAAFIFNGWVFYRFYFTPIGSKNFPEISVLKTKSFDGALERLDQKNRKFNDYKNNLIIEDPS